MRIFAFIDSQNLNLSIKECGWKLDFKKFRKYLSDKFNVKKAFLFIGYVPKNEFLYQYLRQVGYKLIFKPVLGLSKNYIKGNCDAELVLHCMIQFGNFDKSIIISGDGDFYCLIKHLKSRNKLLNIGIPNSRSYSALLREFCSDFFYIDMLRNKLRYKNERYPSRDQPLT